MIVGQTMILRLMKMMADISSFSISSDESMGETMVQVLNYGRRFFKQENVDNPPHFVNQPDILIEDFPDSDMTTLEFCFRKADLKLIVNYYGLD